MEHHNKDERSLSALFGDLAHETSALMQKEVELAKTEINGKISQAKTGLAAMLFGAVFLVVGLIYLVQAIVYGLAETLPPDLSPWLAALIVGGVIAAVGYSLLKKGQGDLDPENLAPHRTIRSAKNNAQFLKEKVNG